MVIVKATNESEDGRLRTPELLEQMRAFNDQLRDAGILVEADGLKPSAKGARIAFSRQNRSVTKGPFPNVHDLVAGYWIWRVNDLNEAIDWVKRCPNPMPGPSVIEIREFFVKRRTSTGRSEILRFSPRQATQLPERKAQYRAQVFMLLRRSKRSELGR